MHRKYLEPSLQLPPGSLGARSPVMLSVQDRSWMYQGWSDNGHHSESWVRNMDAFLDLAFSSVSNSSAERSGAPCPCTQCQNVVTRSRAVLRKHLCKRGFMPGYTRWTEHGESPVVSNVPTTAGHARGTPDSGEPTAADAEAYSAMLRAAQEPLHHRTSVSQLTVVSKLMGVMSRHKCLSEESIDQFLALVHDTLPEGHRMPKTVSECKSLLSALKISPDDAWCQREEECDESDEESSD